ncbi:MAG: hypothetical protein ACRDMA_07190, partial [Solirubrobacterales bacterium]
PSPALIVAIVALVAALAGTAVAADPVASTSVTKKKTKQIAKRIAKKEAGKLLPVGSDELAEIVEHTEILQIPANSHQGLTVPCDSGQSIVSGGWRYLHQGVGNVEARSDHREGNGWHASGWNGTNSSKEFRIHAYCITSG